MFRIKICGITSPADADLAVGAGADAVGINFYPRSSRFVAVDSAREIVTAVAQRALCVGVFVNLPPREIAVIASEVGLDAVQLHGDEPPETVVALTGFRIVRARRMRPPGVAGVAADLEACRAAGRAPDAVLVDAPAAPGQYGGTGEAFAWSTLAGRGDSLGATPLILAGGLRPENVAQAIQIVRPYGVDVASGVERSPGKKDAEQMELFVAHARAALGI